jgi:carboxypeptidase D
MACLRFRRRMASLFWSLLITVSIQALVRAAPTDGASIFTRSDSTLSLAVSLTLPVVPSAASFYVNTLPDLHQDATHPLQMWAGHLSSDPNFASAGPTDVTPHLYFVLTKARRTADKERIIFWFNVRAALSRKPSAVLTLPL